MHRAARDHSHRPFNSGVEPSDQKPGGNRPRERRLGHQNIPFRQAVDLYRRSTSRWPIASGRRIVAQLGLYWRAPECSRPEEAGSTERVLMRALTPPSCRVNMALAPVSGANVHAQTQPMTFRILKLFVLAGLVLVGAHLGNAQIRSTESKPNILFIAVDDLNDWVGFMKGHPGMTIHTPNLDRLAASSMFFTNAHTRPQPVPPPGLLFSAESITPGQGWRTSSGETDPGGGNSRL